MIEKYYFKALAFNKSLWGWGVGFMMFWIVMGAYVFNSPGSFSSTGSAMEYSAGWIAFINLLSSTTVSISVANSVYYANASLVYTSKFTKLKPTKYMVDLITPTIVVNLVIGSIVLLLSSELFSLRAGFSIYPQQILLFLGLLLITGLFMFLVGVSLVLLANNYLGLKNISFIIAIPQMLAYAFGLTTLNLGLPNWIVYGSPFNDILRLAYQFFYGKSLPLNLATGTGTLANPIWFIFSLLAWIFILLIISIILIRKIRYRSIEEARRI